MVGSRGECRAYLGGSKSVPAVDKLSLGVIEMFVKWMCVAVAALALSLVACGDDAASGQCGNGYVVIAAQIGDEVYSEQCDDGNTIDGDGCSSDCMIEPGFECNGPAGQPSQCSEM